MSGSPPFHLAFPVRDLAEARAFYGGLLGLREGRSTTSWVDFDFFGHQISAHLVDAESGQEPVNLVDGDRVPVRHFGAILEWRAWHQLAEALRARGATFLIEPRVRFRGQVGEQATMFLLDPSGNALEFKSFQDPARVFARPEPGRTR
jgi:extradiol dioxygenase family protein